MGRPMRQFQSLMSDRPLTVVERMAEDLREAREARGCADDADLLVEGWTAAQIARHRPEAVALAERLSNRDARADMPVRARA